MAEALLRIDDLRVRYGGIEAVKGITFEHRLTNGLSAIPRMLHGFDDPSYREAGGDFFRISDPARFSVLLEQARNDYSNYLFDKRPEI